MPNADTSPPSLLLPSFPPGEGQSSLVSGGGMLVVGNHCHDVLFLDGRVIGESLGGSTSFISTVLDPLLPAISAARYVSKVGTDFLHHHLLRYSPLPSSSPTTVFHAHFSSTPSRSDRLLRRVVSCDPILPSDLPDSAFPFGVAAAVAGEIPLPTLARMLDLCRVVFVDAQAMIRAFDPGDGSVRLLPLKETGFSRLLPRIAFLKASADEEAFVDVEEARARCCVVVTRGEEGCRLYCRDAERAVPAFAARQVDPTGAGDCFLGGFIAGLAYGLNVVDAALLGNFFGSLAVRQIGLPRFRPCMLQAVRNRLRQKASGSMLNIPNLNGSPLGEDLDVEFQNFLEKFAKVEDDNNDGDDRDDNDEQVTIRENGCLDGFPSERNLISGSLGHVKNL